VTEERNYHLGSAQNEALSSSGTIRVTFRYLAIVTISQICMTKKKEEKVEQLGLSFSVLTATGIHKYKL